MNEIRVNLNDPDVRVTPMAGGRHGEPMHWVSLLIEQPAEKNYAMEFKGTLQQLKTIFGAAAEMVEDYIERENRRLNFQAIPSADFSATDKHGWEF